MKKAFRLVLMYFLVLLLGTAIGMVFYYVYLEMQASVAGMAFTFFKKEDLLRSLLFVLGCALIFICPAMVYARISNKGGAGNFIAFILLSCLTWGLGIPSLVRLQDKLVYQSKDSSKLLTGGYFRECNGKVYYFTTNYNENPYVSTTAVIIDTSDNGTVDVQSIAPTRDFILFRDSAPYSDVLIKDAFNGYSLNWIVSFSLIMDHARNAFAKSWTFWLGFLSIGLLFASLYGTADLFRWRLLNTGFLMCATFAILAVNTLYYHPVMNSFRRQHINTHGFFIFLSKYVDDPLLVMVNVFFSLVFVIIGIVRFATRKKRNY